MRKLYSLALALLVALAIYGCGDTGTVPTQTPIGASAGATATAPATTGGAAATTAPSGNTPAATGPTAPPSTWVPPHAVPGTPIAGAVATLTAAPKPKTGTVQFTNGKGEKVNMTVEIADTESSRELGLMYRSQMPPDNGMLFDFGSDSTGTFWMANTILPLTIAFITGDGKIIHIQDMQPLNKASVASPSPYRYAIEANQGYFRAHGITPGQRIMLPTK